MRRDTYTAYAAATLTPTYRHWNLVLHVDCSENEECEAHRAHHRLPPHDKQCVMRILRHNNEMERNTGGLLQLLKCYYQIITIIIWQYIRRR